MHFHFLIWRIANNPPVTSSFPSFLRRTKIHAGAFDRFRELHARIFAVPSIQESPVQQQPATTFFFRSRCADETIGDQLGFEASLEPPVPFASPQLYFKQPGELVLPSEYMSAAAAKANLDPGFFLLGPAVAAAAAPRAGIWRPVWLVLERPILVVLQLMRRVLFPLKCWSPCLQQSPLLQIGHDDHQHLSISFFPSGGPSSPRSHSQIADGGLDFAFIPLQTAQPVSLATPRPTSPTTTPLPLPTPQPTPVPTPPPTSLPTPQPTSLPMLQPTPVPTPQRTPLPTPHRTPLIRLARNKARIGLPWPLPRSHASHLTRSCLSPQRILAITPTPRSQRRSAPTPMPPQPSHLLRASVTLPLGTWEIGEKLKALLHICGFPPLPSSSLATRRAFVCLGLRLECALLISRLCLPPQQRSSWPVSSRDARSTWPKLFELGPLYLSLGALGEYVRPSQSRDRSLHGYTWPRVLPAVLRRV